MGISALFDKPTGLNNDDVRAPESEADSQLGEISERLGKLVGEG